MTLWNLIRNFFVQNIFGGHYFSNSSWIEKLDKNLVSATGRGNFSENGIDTTSYMVLEGVSLGDWLSTTFTIITLILLVIFLYIFVKWIFKLFSGLLK